MEQAIYWLAGGIGVPLIQWLKKALKIEGKSAMWLTVGISVVLAAAALFISQEISPGDFTSGNILAVFGQVLAAATLAYKFLMEE